MVVSVMHLFRRALEKKFPSVMKKPNPVQVKFKDKSKFDVQNPVVRSLIMQVVDNKKREKEILRALDQAPSIKNLDIEKILMKVATTMMMMMMIIIVQENHQGVIYNVAISVIIL